MVKHVKNKLKVASAGGILDMRSPVTTGFLVTVDELKSITFVELCKTIDMGEESMDHTLRVSRDIFIRTDPSAVWNALTDREMIRQFFFGTEAISDWKVGSSLVFQGEWDGQSYKDKGRIIAVDKGKLLQYSYWSVFSGLADREENYSLVSYRLDSQEGGTLLTVTQKGFAGKEAQIHSGEGWSMVLDSLRKLLEEG